MAALLLVASLFAGARPSADARPLSWITFITTIGGLVAGAATLVLLGYAALGLHAPPSFADPTIPVREAEDEDDDFQHNAV